MDEILATTQGVDAMPAIVDVLIDWLKNKLRQQVGAARDKFADDVPKLVADAVRLRQAERADLRAQDVALVHAAVTDATRRRVEELRTWFDGVDAIGNSVITLHELITATATLFDNVIKDRSITVEIDPALDDVAFEPDEVSSRSTYCARF